jgi:hypothetical protein
MLLKDKAGNWSNSLLRPDPQMLWWLRHEWLQMLDQYPGRRFLPGRPEKPVISAYYFIIFLTWGPLST